MKFIKRHWILVGYVIIILLLYLFSFWASTCDKFEIFGIYDSPRCKVDAVYFTDETCKSCGNEITETGILELSGNSSKNLNFSEHFSSYKNYCDLKKEVLLPSLFMTITALSIPIYSTFVYIKCIEKKKLNRRSKE